MRCFFARFRFLATELMSMIYTVRGEQAMLDSDLAKLYGLETRALNQAVTRNPDRFPELFCFRLTKNEMVIRGMSVTIWTHPKTELTGRDVEAQRD